jgi:hypothetical protein
MFDTTLRRDRKRTYLHEYELRRVRDAPKERIKYGQ